MTVKQQHEYEKKLIEALVALEEILQKKPEEVSININLEHNRGTSIVYGVASIKQVTVEFSTQNHHDITQRVLESSKPTT